MPTILIVDDERSNLLAFGAVLTRVGYTVYAAPAPEEALQVLDRARPDLVLLDINLIRVGQTAGFDLLRRMRARRPTILVVMVSGYLDTPTREAALAAGAVDCWPKPITMQTLRDRVAQVLDTRGQR